MMEAEMCSPHVFTQPHVYLPARGESGEEELSVLPRHTKVVVTGNNRTKSVLVGLQGVVKKAVGFGGWHWLVLKNGIEVKLQRNALSVLEAPTGEEQDEDDDICCDDSFCCSSDLGEKEMDYSTTVEYKKLTKPRLRRTRPWPYIAKPSNQGYQNYPEHLPKPQKRVNLAKLGTAALWRYWKHFDLASINPSPSKEQLIGNVQHHFHSQQLDEMQVIVQFLHRAKRLKTHCS